MCFGYLRDFKSCSDSSLIWLPLSFSILSFLPSAHPSSPIPPSLPPPPLSLIQTYWVRMLSASSLNVPPHRFHRALTHRSSARLLACQFLCSSYFCVTVNRLRRPIQIHTRLFEEKTKCLRANLRSDQFFLPCQSCLTGCSCHLCSSDTSEVLRL